MKPKTVLVLSGLFLILVVAVISMQSSDNKGRPLPEYAYTDPMALAGYTFATEHPDVLSMHDCDCGCYEHAGHANLRDCFIFEGNYTSHASFCDRCKALAVKAQKEYEGVT